MYSLIRRQVRKIYAKISNGFSSLCLREEIRSPSSVFLNAQFTHYQCLVSEYRQITDTEKDAAAGSSHDSRARIPRHVTLIARRGCKSAVHVQNAARRVSDRGRPSAHTLSRRKRASGSKDSFFHGAQTLN